MTRQREDVQYLDGFVKSLWPPAADIVGAEVTQSAIEAFNGQDASWGAGGDPKPPPGDGPPSGPVLNVHDDPATHPDEPAAVGSGTVLDPEDLPTTAEDRPALAALARLFSGLATRIGQAVANTARVVESETEMDLQLAPAVAPVGADRIAVHFPSRRSPGSSHHVFRTRVGLLGRVIGSRPLLQFLVEVRLGLSITFSADDEPVPDPGDPDVRTNRRGRVVAALHDWRDEVAEELEDGDLARELEFLSTARYDPDAAGPARTARPRLVHPDRQLLDDGVNLVLVPDGFAPDELDRFDALVEAARRRLFEPTDDHDNEPFHSFRTALHLWTLVPDQTTNGDHVVTAYEDPGQSRRVALGNLARLAAIGRAAERETSGLTILVFAANHRADRFGGGNARAMAMGKVALVPTRGDDPDAPRRWANVLLHELGHTPLGNLADEYVDDGRELVRYRGQARQAPNLEADASLRAWRPWIDHPDRLPDWDDHPVTGVEGGGFFGRGIWRPARDCLMRSSSSTTPFCAVCREALTRGFEDVLPAGRFLLEVVDASPEPRLLQLQPDDRATTMTGHVRVPANGSVDVRVSLVAGTLPEPWDVEVDVTGTGGLRTDHRGAPDRPVPQRWSFPASVGDRLTLAIRSGCPFTPFDDRPTYTIALPCVPDPDDVQPPSTPDRLVAQHAGRATGALQRAELSARTQDPNGLDVQLEFEVVRAGKRFRGQVTERTGWLPVADGNGRITGKVSHATVDGRHQVRARARNQSGRTSRWSDPVTFELALPRPGDGNGGRPGRAPGDGGGLPGGGDRPPPVIP